MLRKALAVLFLPLIFNCGGPEFAVSYKYEPGGSKSCLSKCYSNYKLCKEKCLEKREKCMEKVRKEAVELYGKAMENYREELNAYRNDYSAYQRELLEWNKNYRELYRDYLYFKSRCKKSKDYLACKRKDELLEALELVEEKKPQPPRKPAKPSLAEIVSELSR